MAAGWRRAIALAFGGSDPAAANGAAQHQGAGVQARFMRPSADPAGDAKQFEALSLKVCAHESNC